jgi:hypothetical protein
MRISTIVFMAGSLLTTAAFAAETTPAAAPAAGAMDMSKMGPWTRKPTAEKATKKEIADFIASCEEVQKKGDFAAALAKVDFPVYMITDDQKGVPEATAMNEKEYTAMMKPFFENMPKDMKTTHKPTITVLSDSLVQVVDDFTMSMGKQKFGGKSATLLVKRDGQWKWKMMSEAGWGGMAPKPASPASAKR